MKHMLLFSAIGLSLLASCSTAYKAGQTPDDVYYSPGREIGSTKEEVKKQEEYNEYISSADDRYLRMKVANGGRWNTLDDYSYWYDSRYDFCPSYYSSPYTSYASWGLGYSFGYNRPYYGSIYGGWNSPVYTLVSYSNPKFSGGYTSGSNISAYRNKSYSNQNTGYTDKTGKFVPAGASNNSAGFANLLKRVFTPSNSSSTNSSYDRPARTFSNSSSTPAPATSSSAGGSSGGFKSSGSSAGSSRGGRG